MTAAGRVGDPSHVPSDSHGCPKCPHDAVGPATTGSNNVYINNMAALRVGDPGQHSSCCGGQTWVASEGAPGVFINAKAAHRVDDHVTHCGGDGKLKTGSPNVFIGNYVKPGPEVGEHFIAVEVLDAFGHPVHGIRYSVTGPASFEGTSERAMIKRNRVPEGKYTLTVPDHPHAKPYRPLTQK